MCLSQEKGAYLSNEVLTFRKLALISCDMSFQIDQYEISIKGPGVLTLRLWPIDEACNPHPTYTIDIDGRLAHALSDELLRACSGAAQGSHAVLAGMTT